MLARLTDVATSAHFAWLAFVGDETGQRPVGVARYIRTPEEAGVAEVAIVVADEFQRRDVGCTLLEAPASVARHKGIERFSGRLRADNRAMPRLLDWFGAAVAYDGPGILRFEVSSGAKV